MGLSIFLDAGCIRCHNGMALGGEMLTRFPLKQKVAEISNGVYQPIFNSARFPFKNRGNFLGKDKMQIFKVPILRNILKTAPYFHNGAIKSLKKAIDIMAKYELGVTLNKVQIDEIYEFFKSSSMNSSSISPLFILAKTSLVLAKLTGHLIPLKSFNTLLIFYPHKYFVRNL